MKRRILLLTDELLPGGVAQHVVSLANELAQAGHGVHVAATNGPFRSRLRPQVGFLDIPLTRSGSYQKNPIGIPEVWGILTNAAKAVGFDIVHSHKRYSDIVARGLARASGTPHVSTCHSTFEGGRWFSCFGYHTIAVSDAIRRMLLTQFAKEKECITTICNEILPLRKPDPEIIAGLRKKYDIGQGTIVLLSVGQFIPAKNHGTLIDALRIVKGKAALPEWKCILVGHGPFRNRLEEQTKSLGLVEHVRFVEGTVDLAPFYGMAGFCVLPSVRDGGIPYTIMEAASLKKPHIASAVGGIPEFITHQKNGVLVPPGDPAALANSIMELLVNPGRVKQLGEHAQHHYEKSHSSRSYVTKTIQIYEAMIQGSNQRL